MSLIRCVLRSRCEHAVNSQWVLNRRFCWNSKRGAKPRTGERAACQADSVTPGRVGDHERREKPDTRTSCQGAGCAKLRKAANGCEGKRAMSREEEKEREKEREVRERERETRTDGEVVGMDSWRSLNLEWLQ